MDNSQIERIGVHKTGLFFIEEFDWIEREQPTSDYGIDMHIEIKENGKATGVLIALQIKSGDSYCKENKSKSIFTYRKGKLRHLEYWKNHSLPVVFIWYRPSNKSLYWQSVSSESENINVNDKGWTLKIPSEQILNNSSKEEILNKCFNINNYQVIEEQNRSINIATRYTLKVIITETNQYIIKRIIKNIYDRYIHLYGDINTLSIFFYRNIDAQMCFCRTQWNNKKYKYKLETITQNDKIDDIGIEWSKDSDYVNRYFSENSNLISKDNYIKKFDKSINLCNRFIEATVNKKIDELEIIIFDFTQDIQEEFNLIADDNYQFSRDVEQLKNIRMSAIGLLQNILIIFQDRSRDEKNKYYLFKSYISDIKKDIIKYNNEKEK